MTTTMDSMNAPPAQPVSTAAVGKPMEALSPPWSTRIETDALSEEYCCYHAEIFHDGNLVCRVSLAGALVTREAAGEALATRLMEWKTEFEARDHMGSDAGVAQP